MKSQPTRLVALYQKRPQMVAICSCVLVLAVLFGLDFALGFTSSFKTLYIVPIWLATRLGGRASGFLSVLLVTIVTTLADSVHTPLTSVAGALPDLLIRFGSFGAIMLLIGQVEEALDKHQQLALQDPLTGLLNRRALTDRAHDAVLSAYALEQPLTVAVIDCDGFKQINDVHGHKTGDQVLQVLARVLEQGTRSTDLVARFGGDEFVVVLQGSETKEADTVMGRIQRDFGDAMRREGYKTSLSVGLATLNREPNTLEELLDRADGAMYAEKERKKSGAYLQ